MTKVVDGLSILFKREEEQRRRRRQRDCNSSTAHQQFMDGLSLLFTTDDETMEIEKIARSQERSVNIGFQVPLDYPSYTKKEYENMEEWEVDVLLEAYGLPVLGDLAYKRMSAMSSFLWPDLSDYSSIDCRVQGFDSHQEKKIKVSITTLVHFLLHGLGFAYLATEV